MKKTLTRKFLFHLLDVESRDTLYVEFNQSFHSEFVLKAVSLNTADEKKGIGVHLVFIN